MLARVLQIVCLVLGGLLTLAYAYQVIYLFVPMFLRRKREKAPCQQKRYAILIAARNEEAVIGNLLDSIEKQSYPRQLLTVFVIADNCTDATAQVAADHGAIVYTRFNQEKIGKGYAIAYLLEKIREDYTYEPFDAFVIFDADNLLKNDYMVQLNKVAAMGYQVFSGYRNSKNFGQNWISAGHSLWYLHDSAHLNRSRMLLNVGCVVTGTGYGFTRALLEQMGGWNFHCLTEDIEFSTWCATHNIKTGYSYNAILYDEQPRTMQVSWKQRTRWSQGGIQVSLAYFKKYFQGMRQGGWAAWTSFEMMTLGLWGYGTAGLCGFLSLLAALLSGGWAGIGFYALTALVGTYFSMFAMGGLTLISEWKRIHATTGQKLMALFTFPIYVATFLPIAVCSLFSKFEWTPIEHTEAISMEDLPE